MAIKICLDAGHQDKYNRSPVVKEYYESDMNWKLHLYLKDELEKYGIKVITTRETQNTKLGLYDRGYMSKGCDLFLSIHSNACDRESADHVVIIPLLDDKKIKFDDVSRQIGDKLGKVIRDTMGVKKYQMYTRKNEKDWDGNGYYDDEWYGVLNGAKQAGTPGIILEHSFHTNTKATKWLLVDDNLKELAKAEAKCLAEHYNQTKPEPVKKEEPKKFYRVRKSWEDSKSQIGAYEYLENAKKYCKEGYSVYDWNGKEVYSKKYRLYTVVKGDTLWKIAERFLGKGERYIEIKELSGLKSNMLHSGDVLKIPNK